MDALVRIIKKIEANTGSVKSSSMSRDLTAIAADTHQNLQMIEVVVCEWETRRIMRLPCGQ